MGPVGYILFHNQFNRSDPWVTYFFTINLIDRTRGLLTVSSKPAVTFSYNQRIDGVRRGLLTVSSKSVVTFLTSSELMEPVGYLRCLQNLLLLFLTTSESMGSVGYIRCLQNLLLLSYKQPIDGSVGYIRCLHKMLLTPNFYIFVFLKAPTSVLKAI